MNQLLCLLAFISPAVALLGIGQTQSVAVQGRLICGGSPAQNVKVKLYEKESTFDVKLDETSTNSNGEFRVAGFKSEITPIDPKVNIYHKCNYHGPCYKKIGITIPDSFITKGKTADKVYDVGTLNLANQYNGQTTDCLN